MRQWLSQLGLTLRPSRLVVLAGVCIVMAASGLSLRAWQQHKAAQIEIARYYERANRSLAFKQPGQSTFIQNPSQIQTPQVQSVPQYAAPYSIPNTQQPLVPRAYPNYPGTAPPAGIAPNVRQPAPTRMDTKYDPEINQLLGEISQAGENFDRVEKEKLLKELVDKQFQLRHNAQLERLKTIQASIAAAQRVLDKREGSREQIVERRVSELLGQRDPLNWSFQPEQDMPGETPLPTPSTYYVPTAPQQFAQNPNFGPRQQYRNNPLSPGTSTSPSPGVPGPDAYVPGSALPPVEPKSPPPTFNSSPTPESTDAALQLDTSRPSRATSEGDIMDAAYAVVEAKDEVENLSRLFKVNAVSSSELRRAHLSLEKATTRLESQEEHLSNQIRLAEMDLAREQRLYSIVMKQRDRTEKIEDRLEAETQAIEREAATQKAKIALEQLVVQVEWLNDFKKKYHLHEEPAHDPATDTIEVADSEPQDDEQPE